MRRRESGQVESLLEYGEQTAGRIMNPQVFALSEDLTVGEAITALQSSRDVEMVFYLYVVDARRHLVGVTSLRRLLLVSPETPLKRIMTPEVTSVRVDTDQEEVARQVASYNLLAVPVVDEESKLVGIVTVDDVIDVIKDEATEDLLRLAGVSGDERMATPAWEAIRKRLPWLAVNLGDRVPRRLGRGAVRGHDPAGHGTGRVHADRRGDGWQCRDADTDGDRARTCAGRVVVGQRAQGAARRKPLIGLGNGLALGVIAAGIAWATKSDPMLGLLLGMAMVVNMFVAATAGTLVPLGLKAMKIDPALASSVFITTFTDVVGFASFLGLATIFLRYLVKVRIGGYGMPLYTAEALVLRTYKLGEADRIVVFLTRDRGKKRGVAPNARKSRKRFGAALEPLTEVRMSYFEKERRELVGLNYAEPVRSPLSAASPEALGYSHYFAELIDEWAAEADVDEKLFRLGTSALEALLAGAPVEALARYFECWLLRLQGVYPPDLSLSSDAATFLDGVRRVAPRDVESLGASSRVLREIELIHRKLIAMHLEREPRSVRVLNELRRS